jgi:hypothetical protein
VRPPRGHDGSPLGSVYDSNARHVVMFREAFDNGTEPPGTGTRARHSTCRARGQARLTGPPYVRLRFRRFRCCRRLGTCAYAAPCRAYAAQRTQPTFGCHTGSITAALHFRLWSCIPLEMRCYGCRMGRDKVRTQAAYSNFTRMLSECSHMGHSKVRRSSSGASCSMRAISIAVPHFAQSGHTMTWEVCWRLAILRPRIRRECYRTLSHRRLRKGPWPVMVQPYHVASRPNVPFDMQVCGKKTAAGAKRAEAERKAVAEAERIVSGTPGRLEGGLCGSTRLSAPSSRLGCPG